MTALRVMTEAATPQGKKAVAQRRLRAWTRVLEAVADQRDALDNRTYREHAFDVHLAADVQTWCELTKALSDFLEARSAA